MTLENRRAEILDLMNQYFAPNQSEDWPLLPVTKTEGTYLFGIDGKKYLDFIAGFAVANCGHNHPQIVEAAKRQSDNLVHCAVGVTLYDELFTLCEKLTEQLPEGLNTFFFGNSGAEAVEGAIKLARFVRRRPGIIAFEGSFHGRTYGAASVGGTKAGYRLHYEPFLPGVYFAPYAYPYRCPLGADPESATTWSLSSIQRILDHLISPTEVAAILVEPVQGEGGYIIPPASFLMGLRKICDDHGILLIFDEIQTGFGRTGEMFASQTFGVIPDIMAVGKGIANGYPLSATIARRDIMRQWSAGSHGTTYGGNPISCAAAIATLEVIQKENLLESCRRQGERLLRGLHALKDEFSAIGDVRGLGLMVAMEIVKTRDGKEPDGDLAQQARQACLDRGLLTYSAGIKGQVIRMMPPLNVTDEQVDQALEILREGFQATFG